MLLFNLFRKVKVDNTPVLVGRINPAKSVNRTDFDCCNVCLDCGHLVGFEDLDGNGQHVICEMFDF